jgi:hypothetical protein
LILVGACNSEEIGKLIKNKVKKAIVIAINKNTPILDEAGTLFAKCFYDNLLQGKTIKKSFELA